MLVFFYLVAISTVLSAIDVPSTVFSFSFILLFSIGLVLNGRLRHVGRIPPRTGLSFDLVRDPENVQARSIHCLRLYISPHHEPTDPLVAVLDLNRIITPKKGVREKIRPCVITTNVALPEIEPRTCSIVHPTSAKHVCCDLCRQIRMFE